MKPNIAVFITNFESGGAQKIALTHASAFIQRGYSVKLIAIETLESFHIPDELDLHILTNQTGHTSKLMKLMIFFTLPFRLAQYLKKNNIDICISHLERADFINILSRIIYPHKTVSVIHSHLTTNYKNPSIRNFLYKHLVQLLEPLSSRIVTVSRGIEADLINMGLPKNKIQTILNPFDVDQIQLLAQEEIEEYSPILGHNTIISIGRLDRVKGFWHSILAFHKVLSSTPANFIIIGEGQMKDYYIEFARNLGLKVYTIWDNQPLTPEYDIYFLGFQKNPFKFIAHSEIFVLSSHYEGLPTVLVESLIIGTPIIAPDCDSGPRELIAPNTDIHMKTTTLEMGEYGILTPTHNDILPSDTIMRPLDKSEQLLAEAIELLLKNRELANAYKSKFHMDRIQNFELNTIMLEWDHLLSQLHHE